MGERLAWRWRLGGMIPDWQRYQDPVNGVARPVQMGPLWIEARHLTGAVIDERIWVEDPPASSWPASIAVKAAALQSPAAGESLLHRLWRGAMAERRNIARPEVIRALAAEVAGSAPGLLDPDRLAADLATAQAAFADDLKECRFREIARFPTLTLVRPADRAGAALVGFRPFEALADAVARVEAGAPPRA
jgi:predicted DsbA family dithiol-disulfide isomerase